MPLLDLKVRCGRSILPALGPEDFDVIFAYPWPDEERLTEHLFECRAAVGAVLMTYHESGDFRLGRKIGH